VGGTRGGVIDFFNQTPDFVFFFDFRGGGRRITADFFQYFSPWGENKKGTDQII